MGWYSSPTWKLLLMEKVEVVKASGGVDMNFIQIIDNCRSEYLSNVLITSKCLKTLIVRINVIQEYHSPKQNFFALRNTPNLGFFS